MKIDLLKIKIVLNYYHKYFKLPIKMTYNLCKIIYSNLQDPLRDWKFSILLTYVFIYF